MSIVLSEQSEPFLRRRSRILAPLSNPQTQEAILSISQSLLHKAGGEIVVLSVVTAPEQIDFYSVLGDSEASIEILETSTRRELPSKIEIQPMVRVSRSLARGIIDAAEEQGCSLIVMGYEGDTTQRPGSLTEELLRFTRTDVVMLKVQGDFRPKKIAASLVGTENLDLIVTLASAIADWQGAQIAFLSILPSGYSAERKSQADNVLTEAIRRHRGRALYRTEVLSSDSPLETLVERSGDFDLLIVGSSRVGLFEKIVVGAFATQIVERSRCSVAVVRAIPPSRKTLARVVGR